jgi:hypothetical protein
MLDREGNLDISRYVELWSEGITVTASIISAEWPALRFGRDER